jgi:Na+-driven multidrug efflux pump
MADLTMIAFSGAFFCDWLQCCLAGVIKGVGKQAIASIASFFCMFAVSFPMSWYLGINQGLGLPGFWIGYGCASLILSIWYSCILLSIDWS